MESEEIDFGDLDVTDSHAARVQEMLEAGYVNLDGLAIQLQENIDEMCRQFAIQRRQDQADAEG